ncbi:hypothetical protein CQA44_04515 [Helicobacter sp. MIT 14-3879]|nr:hypothetical protein CQA44_04515 [Helicobacter sp. MIT 14-3879]
MVESAVIENILLLTFASFGLFTISKRLAVTCRVDLSSLISLIISFLFSINFCIPAKKPFVRIFPLYVGIIGLGMPCC